MSPPPMQKISATPLAFCTLLTACAGPGAHWVDEWPVKRDERLTLVLFAAPDRPLSAFVEKNARSPRVLAALGTDFVAVRSTAGWQPELFELATDAKSGLALAVFDAQWNPLAAHVGYADESTIVNLVEHARIHAAEVGRLRELLGNSPHDVLDPSEDDTFALAQALGQGGLPHLARQTIARCRLAHGARPDILAWRARLEIDAGDIAEAKSWHARSPRAHPSLTAHRAYTEAKIAAAERRYTDAALAVEQALTSHPDYEERDAMRLFRAECLHEAGNDNAAIESLRHLLTDSTDAMVRRRILETLEHIRSADHGHTH